MPEAHVRPVVPKEPLARGVLVAQPQSHAPLLQALAKESVSILRALNAEGRVEERAPADADFVVLLVEEGSAPTRIPLPELKDRAASALGIGASAPEARVAVAAARKHLRAHGATLGARELVFSPDDFGYLGLETDGLREKLEILLQALVLDAERLRLRREGWEEPDAR